MNSDAIGAIAELMGAVGVIATLVYLARQINQSTSTLRSSAATAHTQASQTLSLVLAAQHPSPDKAYLVSSRRLNPNRADSRARRLRRRRSDPTEFAER